MYDPETQAAAACFDPNNIMPNSGDINATNVEQNTSSFTQIDHNFNNNNNLQEIDSNSMPLEFQNPNLNHNWSTTNIDNVSHEMSYQQFDENIHTTTSDLLTLLHLPRCSFGSSSTPLVPPPPHTPSISFSKSSSPPPPPPGLAAFLGDMNPNAPGSGGLSTISYDPASVAATLPYNPLFHLNLPPQPSPLLRDLMFHGYTTSNNGVPTTGNVNGNANCSSLFAQLDDGEGSNINMSMNMNMNMNMHMNGISGIYQDNNGGEHLMNTNAIFEFARGASLDDGKLGKGPKNFVTERQRRQNFNDKYQQLRSLIPTPTKMDRASIVFDAISYINELKRTVGELKLLVEKKRISKERNKRLKTEDNNPSENGGEHNNGHGVDGTCLVKPDPDDAFAGSTATQLRSSWLQRKCKDTEVDVRIVDDEVTIKLVQRKKMNCLLSVSRTLDDLQLDLRHVAGGHVGDYYSYLFNSKICEGSSVYASAIANKLIEVVERQYAAASVAVAPTTSF